VMGLEAPKVGVPSFVAPGDVVELPHATAASVAANASITMRPGRRDASRRRGAVTFELLAGRWDSGHRSVRSRIGTESPVLGCGPSAGSRASGDPPRSRGPEGAGPVMSPATPPPDPDELLRERLLDSRVLHRGRYLTFRVDRVQRADGSVATRDVCGHPGAVAILALDDDDNVLLVHQWRHPADGVLLEIPAGTLDVDDTTGDIEDHRLAAPRELEEETGMRAATWRLLTSFWTAPGFATELMHLYLATGLTPAREDRLGPDEDERLLASAVPWRVALAMAEAGEIRDAKSIVGLFWLARLMDHHEMGRTSDDPGTRAVGEVLATLAGDRRPRPDTDPGELN
jgi:ADP-ribose pyrophosphatase